MAVCVGGFTLKERKKIAELLELLGLELVSLMIKKGRWFGQVDHKEDADWMKGRWFGQVDHKDADWKKGRWFGQVDHKEDADWIKGRWFGQWIIKKMLTGRRVDGLDSGSQRRC